MHNIVIVHGAFADGSGWRRTADVLLDQGFDVTVVQSPLTSLADDVDTTRRVLDTQDGSSLLVGHDYGGMVISEAGNRPDVAGLVYVAAFQPDKGESLIALASGTPPTGERGIKSTKDGAFLYLDPATFAADFAADLPQGDVRFMARSQVFVAKAAFAAKAASPAWRDKRSWAIVATEDRTIHPDLERHMAHRAASKITELRASHAVYMSQPDQVAEVIAAAARAVGV